MTPCPDRERFPGLTRRAGTCNGSPAPDEYAGRWSAAGVSRHAKGEHPLDDRRGEPVQGQALVHRDGAPAGQGGGQQRADVEGGVLECPNDGHAPGVIGECFTRSAPAGRGHTKYWGQVLRTIIRFTWDAPLPRRLIAARVRPSLYASCRRREIAAFVCSGLLAV